jgi:hypothetical protein
VEIRCNGTKQWSISEITLNNFHRYINLPFEISRPDYTYETPEHVVHKNLPTDIDEYMSDFLKQFGLTLVIVETFFTPPNGGKVPIHTDYTTEFTNYVKINMTWGPEDGAIVWWDCDETFEYTLNPGNLDDGKTKVKYDNSSTILTAHEENCKIIHTANTNRPSLLNTGCLHSTINPSNEPRWTLCFIPAYRNKMDSRKNWFDACVKWEDAVEIFKDYLE